MTDLTLKSIWRASGYRDLTLTMVDPTSRMEYELHLPPKAVQRLIHECADAVRQIGEKHPPIDWDQYPTQILWPEVTPWMAGPRAVATLLTLAIITVWAGIARSDAWAHALIGIGIL